MHRLEQPTSRNSTTFDAFLVCVCLLLFFISFWQIVEKLSFTVGGQKYFLLADDAMISMRYAYNLVHSLCLDWNPGERVQGITNLGWTLIMAAAHLLPLSASQYCLLIAWLAALSLAGLALVVFRQVRRTCSSFLSFLAMAVTCFSAPLLVYSAAGLEQSLQALLLTSALCGIVPRSRQAAQLEWSPLAAPLCAVAFLVRPDSLVFCAWAILLSFFLLKRKTAMIASGFAAALVAAVFLFQQLHFGSLLPNTYYLKSYPGFSGVAGGLAYTADYLLSFSGLVAVLSVIYCIWGLSGKNRLAFLPLAGMTLTWFAYVIYIGGDCFPCGRFFAPLIPLMVLASAYFLSDLQRLHSRQTGARRRASAGAVALVAGTLASSVSMTFVEISPFLSDIRDGNREMASAAYNIQQLRLPEDQRLAVVMAGVIPYLLPAYRFDDLLGKCDPHIAHQPIKWGRVGHNKWDMTYSLELRRPSGVICALNPETESDDVMQKLLDYRADLGYFPSLWLHPHFVQYYRPNPIRLSDKLFLYFNQPADGP